MTRKCPICGEEFEPNPARPAQRFCSRKCKKVANRRAADRRKAAKLAAGRKQLVCPFCGKSFRQARITQRFCSKACSKAYWKRTGHQRVAEARGERKCAWCGKDISHRKASAKFCSWQCKHAAKRRRARATQCEPLSDQAHEASLARVRAYLALPPAERWAKRGTLTAAEHKLASKMYDEAHSVRAVAWNWLPH